MELALVACLGWVATTYLFIRHIAETERHHALQVSGLLNRIQAPEATVTQELIPEGVSDEPLLPHTEDSYWKELANA